MVSRSRMPPPSWIGVFSPIALIISRMTFSFFGRPATAPFRSTMCSRRAPWADQCRAIATGSSENTVAESMRPCCKRTQWPSLRSIAGMISTGCCEPESAAVRKGRLRPPLDKVGQQPQAEGLALFRMELHGKDVIPRHRAGKGDAVGAGAGGDGAVRGFGVIAVHEIEAAAIRDSFPQRMRARLRHFV